MLSLRKQKTSKDGLVGLTIRTDGVTVAHVSRSGGKPRLLGCQNYPVDQLTSLDAVLKKVAADRKFSGSPVNSILNPGEFHLQLIEKPQVEEQELKQAVRWKIKEMIDFPVEEAVIDVFEIPGQKEKGRTELIYVIAAKREVMQSHIKRLEDQRFSLEVVDIPELAQRNIAALLPEERSGLAFLSLREQGGLLTISKESVLYLSRQLELGLSSLAPASSTEETPDDLAVQDQISGLYNNLTTAISGRHPTLTRTTRPQKHRVFYQSVGSI